MRWRRDSSTVEMASEWHSTAQALPAQLTFYGIPNGSARLARRRCITPAYRGFSNGGVEESPISAHHPP